MTQVSDWIIDKYLLIIKSRPLFSLPFIEGDKKWRGYEDGGIGAYNNSDDEQKSKIFSRWRTYKIQGKKSDKDGQRSVDRSTESLGYRLAHYNLEILAKILLSVNT